MVSDDGTVVKAEYSHNHQLNLGDVQARQLRGNMRDETTSMLAIYDQEKVKLLQQSSTALTSLCFNTSEPSHHCTVNGGNGSP